MMDLHPSPKPQMRTLGMIVFSPPPSQFKNLKVRKYQHLIEKSQNNLRILIQAIFIQIKLSLLSILYVQGGGSQNEMNCGDHQDINIF